MTNSLASMSPTARRLASHPAIRNLSSDKGEIFAAPAFLLPHTCDAIIGMTDQNNYPSKVADANGDAMFRTSSTANLPENEIVSQVRKTIAHLLGLPLTHGEPLQGQRYQPGQTFKLHNDWFRPDSPDYATYCAIGGQRTWTAMAYLNNVEAGGETEFPHLGVKQVPEQGLLLMWNNHTADGELNPMVAHHAHPVGAGSKYVITQWFREQPYQ